MDTWRFELPENAAVFLAPDGQQIVYLTGQPQDEQALYSPDGQNHYPLLTKGFGGTIVEHKFFFEDPHHRRKGWWRRAHDELLFDGVIFSKVTAPREVTLVPRPPESKREFLFRRRRDDCLIYLRVDVYKFLGVVRRWRLFEVHADMHVIDVDDHADVREIIVDDVRRPLRDRSTVKTAEGDLYMPGAGWPQKPTWCGEEVEQLDSKRFVIRMSDAGLTIRPS